LFSFLYFFVLCLFFFFLCSILWPIVYIFCFLCSILLPIVYNTKTTNINNRPQNTTQKTKI
jgi:hypothetical protein